MSIKKTFFFLALIATVAGSYMYSDDIYRLHLMVYYRKIKRVDYDKMMMQAKDLFRMKKYRELEDHLRIMAVIFDNRRNEIRRLQGLNFIKMGFEKKGIDIFVSTLGDEKIESSLLTDIIGLMYSKGLYYDIVKILKKNKPDNYRLIFIYGVSQFKTGNYNSSLRVLTGLKKRGEGNLDLVMQTDLNKYLGLAYVKKKDYKNGMKYMMRAYRLNPRDREVRKSLVDIYIKTGRYRKAEKLIRLKGWH